MQTQAIAADEPVRPTRYRWVVAFLFFIIYTIAAADRANLGVALPFLRKEFAMSNAEAGGLVSLFLIAYACAQLPSAWLLSRFGVRKVFTISMILTSVTTGLTGLVGSLLSLKACRFALGLAEGPLPIGVTVAAQPVDPQPQWRLLLAGGEDVIGLRRPVLAHLLSQPCRPQGIGRRRRQALALRASQQRIDQLVLVGAAQSPHGLDGGRQRRMGRQAHHHHLGEAHMQQRAQFVLAASQRLGHPGREGGVAAGTGTQHRETDRLEQRAIAGVLHPGEIGRQFGLQRAAAMHHRIDHTGRDDPHRDARLGGHGVTRSRRALR